MNEQPAPGNVVDIAKFLSTEKLTKWVEYRDGIELHLVYVPRERLRKLTQDCTAMKYSVDKKQRLPEVDSKRLMRDFAGMAVDNWRGVTLDSLSRVIQLDVSSVPAEQRKAEIPFSLAQIGIVLEHGYDLDTFLQENATEIRIFNPEHEDELKNSNSSQTGN